MRTKITWLTDMDEPVDLMYFFYPDLFVIRKILSSEYQLYACGKIFRMPRSLRLPDLERKSY